VHDNISENNESSGSNLVDIWAKVKEIFEVISTANFTKAMVLNIIIS